MELMRGQIVAEGEKWAHGMPQHKDGTPVEPPFPLVSDEFRANYEAITGKKIDNWGNNPLKPGTYVVVGNNYYDPANPKIKAAIDAGWKPEMKTIKGE